MVPPVDIVERIRGLRYVHVPVASELMAEAACEIERLRNGSVDRCENGPLLRDAKETLEELSARRVQRTHYDGCRRAHVECLIAALVDELTRLHK
jgi:hypothetical protein